MASYKKNSVFSTTSLKTGNFFIILFFFLILGPGLTLSQEMKGSCNISKKRICEDLVKDTILWRIDDPDSPVSKHWAQKNLNKLCACTNDPYTTVNCFQVQVNNNHKT
ncbi:hypothetical protein LBMAG20_15190 [Methylocystaceae bacterium]|jgi:hypothetical protein|nr:hypothetical protein LBMAG20_15190 [Methylocystaceae bacterium]